MKENSTNRPATKTAAHDSRATPGLKALWGGRTERKAFLQYWVIDAFQNGVDLTLFYGMKLLTADMCSALGARLGLFAMPRWHKGAIKKARSNLARLLPDMPEGEREALIMRNWANQGRLMTEFSVVMRMAADRRRVERIGTQHLIDAAGRGPVILVGLHLGNWELITSIVTSLGIIPGISYEPPRGRARRWIAGRVRLQAGSDLLPPGRSGARPMLKRLRDGGVVSIFCDEGFKGKIRGPFLGRTPHLDGNLALVARLARHTHASICPVYTIRSNDSARFQFHALPPIKLPGGNASDAQIIADVLLLNSVIEPIVRAHLDQWYFLDNAL
ncbi:lipid A biosynthesis lauroyl acyltransferase [Pararhizobium sp. LjRoot235]|uniref:lysophospholipid acyltransferase family protein n=1 Tax=Pararhizobium sp. LjRoot235 TaxID=3342291 RepID=UPI003ECECE19